MKKTPECYIINYVHAFLIRKQERVVFVQNFDSKYIDSNFCYRGFLGVRLSKRQTDFYIWAPSAEDVSVNLFKSASDSTPFYILPLLKGDKGVWSLNVPKSLDGIYYTYNYTYSSHSHTGVDPYAKAVSANGEKGYICDIKRLDPKGWDNYGYVKLDKYTDAVLYEAHVRDFSSDPSSGVSPELRGKYRAFTQESTHTPSGRATCLSYLVDLGVTHVHLLPIFDYGRLNELDPQSDYNWGYDPENYNVPEGSYSSDPRNPEARIRELKELILTLHKKGIGAVMDVVYNHTYSLENSNLNKSFPSYYYRYKDGKPSNGSGCGNEIASERSMCRKYIIDSVLYWAKEYKIDGFRFDLMAVLDAHTLNELAERLMRINPSVILYGEGWSGGPIALSPELAASKQNSYKTPDYAYFNDSFRDAVKGPTFFDVERGYISGNFHLRSSVINGLLGKESWACDPYQRINYCEAHDNLTLWDKLSLSASGSNLRDRKKMARLAAALVLLSQGVPFLHAGQEFLRSKDMGNGEFDHNSYRSPDSVNSMKWYMLDENGSEAEYIKELIAFRKAHPLLRMSAHEEVEDHSEVMPSSDGTIQLRLFDESEELLIFVNPIPRAKVFILPDGEWEMLVSDTMASEKPMGIYCEGVFVPPISVMVLRKMR